MINHGPNQIPFSVWARMRQPNGVWTAPTLGPVVINPPVNVTVTRLRVQNIPGSYMAGMYLYVGYAGLNYPNPVVDSSSFTFLKTPTVSAGPRIIDETCTGEPFPGEIASSNDICHSSFILYPSHPNPFNPTTIIGYELRAASSVSLKVYDTAGRLAVTLADGWRESGTHQVTFDGSKLASGLYFVRMEAEGFTAVQKLLLIK